LKQFLKNIRCTEIPARQCILIAGLILLLDQLTKIAVVRCITSPVKIIPGLFDLVFVENTGAAWGILRGKGWLLLIISTTVLFLIIYFIRMITEGWIERYYAISLIAAGILGTSIDRISVVDFLDFYAGTHHWPAFNVADSAICVGAFLFVLSSWIRPQAGTDKGPQADG
jgi:signal peptidase II